MRGNYLSGNRYQQRDVSVLIKINIIAYPIICMMIKSAREMGIKNAYLPCHLYILNEMMLESKGLLPPLIPDYSALRALTILKNIRNPLIFLRKMASYSCFWRVPRLKIFMQASLHQISNLLTLVSCNYFKDFIFSESSFNCSSEGIYCIFSVSRQISKPHFFSSSSICPLACPPQP